MKASMEEFLAVLDTHAGLLRAFTEAVTAMASTLTPQQPAAAHDKLMIARQLAAEQDVLQPKSLASVASRDAALEAFCNLLRQRACGTG